MRYTITMTQKLSLFATFIGFGVFLAIVLSFMASNAKASAPTGLPATIATTSPATVGTTAISVFATSSCSARIITTYASPVMLTFSDYSGQTPTGTFGHLQAASTTVVYDSGQYGCGLVKVYSFTTQTITVSEKIGRASCRERV